MLKSLATLLVILTWFVPLITINNKIFFHKNWVINVNFITIYTLFVTNFLFVPNSIHNITKLKSCHYKYKINSDKYKNIYLKI